MQRVDLQHAQTSTVPGGGAAAEVLHYVGGVLQVSSDIPLKSDLENAAHHFAGAPHLAGRVVRGIKPPRTIDETHDQ